MVTKDKIIVIAQAGSETKGGQQVFHPDQQTCDDHSPGR